MSEITGQLGGERDASDLDTPEEPGPLDPDAVGARWLRRHMASGLTALTTIVGAEFRAATVASATVVSTDPLLILVSLEADGVMAGWVHESGVFGLSILAWRDQFLADQFAGSAPRASRNFEGIQHTIALTGAPLLAAAIGWADCEVVSRIETGDHVCFVGKAVAAGVGGGHHEDPLVYYLNRYRRLR